ncbi:hypothetical protein L6452_34944 [Arctium lappa]|uniref:Uncharacterized protein n=1 Tax=Arctium lappa TaxID=4217 RepID=A0ACB8YK61_ARCLA|nr:hypothetical protein L6452_34944 [Arctium lappa]
MINFLEGFVGVKEGMLTNISYEGTPIKEKTKAKQEETLAQKIAAIKRKKSIATKPKAKRVRTEEEENVIENEDPVQVDPISMKAPEIIFWDILKDNRKEYFRFKRMGDQFEVYATWGKVIRSCSKADLEEMYKVGTKLYETVLQGTEMSLLKIAMEYLLSGSNS